MVFKSIHLARQTFTKALGHGYAQSVVAATQSSYASSTSPYTRAKKSARPQTAQLHTSFQNVSGQSNATTRTTLGSPENVDRNDGDPNLHGYYEALWKRQQDGEEFRWGQYQFPKRIGWKGPSLAPDGKQDAQAEVTETQAASSDRQGLDRAYTTSAVDEIKRTEDEVAEAVAVSQVDEAIAQVITEFKRSKASIDESQESAPGAAESITTSRDVVQAKRSSTPLSASPNEIASPKSSDTGATSVQDTAGQAFSVHISNLLEQSSYAQIPHVFQSMLLQGLQPTVGDYNALLASAVHLPIARHQIAPKALDVYTDLLRRKITPDAAFYTTLVEVLSTRALEVVQMRNSLDTKRMRLGRAKGDGGFLFPSTEAEYDILVQDDALQNAVKIFQVSISSGSLRQYPSETYQKLITACALHAKIEDMIAIYTHMESCGVKPTGAIFPSMIEAFAKTGDLSSVVDCYNEYKSIAVKDDAGQFVILDRKDREVYAAVVRAYANCGKMDGGHRFLSKIVDSYGEVTELRKEELQAVQDCVVLEALVETRLGALDFAGALKVAEERNLTPFARSQAMARICTFAADRSDLSLASKAFQYLSPNISETSTAIASMLGLHIRLGNLDSAKEFWDLLSTRNEISVDTTASYAAALISSGHVEKGATLAREAFTRIRANIADANLKGEVSDEIDEAIELLGSEMRGHGTAVSATASMALLWAMVENGGLVTSVAEQVLAGLGPEEISNLIWQDMILALQVEAGLLGNSNPSVDMAHSARFSHLLDIAVNSGRCLDQRTTSLVEKAFGKVATDKPGIFYKWHNFQQASSKQAYVEPRAITQHLPTAPSASSMADSYDPYAVTTDYRGSTIIADELENRRNSAGLNEALVRFRNIRRAGRHPRYIAYAKLISAAAKEGRTNLIHDLLGMARTDLPFLPQYPVVRHGWSTILDAMVGACLTVGRRPLAEQFHQEMLEMGSAPTANTFGLYITTLKDSTRTFDEASEAVAIFGRAISEGVTPSSFLYNALIGKLGKARRIDDCLRYFQEMRTAGIRPTSVTYGTVVNALCRVSDDRFVEELFDEMESMPNYKPRPAPYNSLMQYFLTTKRDSEKVLSYYHRMQSKNIEPTMHTYKLLIDTYATLDPVNLVAAEGILDTIRASGQRPEAVHYASLIHAKGCALHDMEGSRRTFDEVLASGEIKPQACLYQALFESMVANHCVAQTEEVLGHMAANGVDMTPYIANTLIHGWAMENTVGKSKIIYDNIGMEKREPSTYEAMTRAFLTAEDRDGALGTVHEMLSRGYPSAVSSKILELVGHGSSRAGSVVLSDLMA